MTAKSEAQADDVSPNFASFQASDRSRKDLVLLAAILFAYVAFSAVTRFFVLPDILSSFFLLVLSTTYLRQYPTNHSSNLSPRGKDTFALFILLLVVLVFTFETKELGYLSTIDKPLSIANLLIAVPIAEEFFFRGCLLSSLEKDMGKFFAALLCSIFFAALHLPSGGALQLFLLSMTSSIAYQRSHCLLLPIAIHVAWNSIALGLSNAAYPAAITLSILLLLARRQNKISRSRPNNAK